MTAREEILNRVRKGLNREGKPVPPPPPVRLKPATMDREQRVAGFQAKLEALAGKVYRAADLADARAIIAQIRPKGTAVATNSDVLRRTGVLDLPDVVSGFQQEAELRKACADAACGITAADYGFAETGSLVTFASSEARLVSLLPPVHIAVLLESRLLVGLDELYARHPLPAEGSSSMVFITGPSRSADIEMILVRGVHGPKAIHVIVVAKDS